LKIYKGKVSRRFSSQFSVFSSQLSVFSCQLSVVSYQLSVFSCQLSVFSFQLSVVSYQLSVISVFFVPKKSGCMFEFLMFFSKNFRYYFFFNSIGMNTIINFRQRTLQVPFKRFLLIFIFIFFQSLKFFYNI
jgi:hypothetical protein